MQQTAHSTTTDHGKDKARLRRAVLMLAASAGLALSAAACGGGPADPAASASGETGNVTAGGAVKGDGEAGGGSGQRSAGSFSLAFARCMRAHAVPDFPDPNGQSGQLGPASGIDPNSPQFQSALNGPCESLAPPGWVGSGKVTH